MSRDRDEDRGGSRDRYDRGSRDFGSDRGGGRGDDRGDDGYRRGRRDEYRMFVGNLPQDIRERELDDLFYKYGKINHISIKNHKEGVPAFAFVAFDSYNALDDAIYYRDGHRFDGQRIRCEKTKDREDMRDRDRRGGRDDRRGGRDDRRGGRDDRGRGDRERKPREKKPPRGPPVRTEFGVLVTGLKENSRWQNLKDLFRPVGASLCYANIEPDGSAIVEFTSEEDSKAVAEKFDGHEHEGEIISVKVAGPGECGEGVGAGPKMRAPKESRGPDDAPKDALIDDGGEGDGRPGGEDDGEKEAATGGDEDAAQEGGEEAQVK